MKHSLRTPAVLRKCATFRCRNMVEQQPNRMEPLKGKVALVTGAAKRIGREVALHLAGESADVVVHYRASRPEAEDTVAQIKRLGRRAIALHADLSRTFEIKRLFEDAAQHFG